MKFPIILILASLAGALVCGQENPSDTEAQERADDAANSEAPEETTLEPVTVTAESSEAALTTLATENSAENQAATLQKAEPCTPRSSIFRTAATVLKNKIEAAEKNSPNKWYNWTTGYAQWANFVSNCFPEWLDQFVVVPRMH